MSRPLLLTALQSNSAPSRLAIVVRSVSNVSTSGASYSHVLLPLPNGPTGPVKSYCFIGLRMYFTDGSALYSSALEWGQELAFRTSLPIYSASGIGTAGASSIERVTCDPVNSSSRVFLLERSQMSMRISALNVDPLTVNAARLHSTGIKPREITRQALDNSTQILSIGSFLYSARHRCAYFFLNRTILLYCSVLFRLEPIHFLQCSPLDDT